MKPWYVSFKSDASKMLRNTFGWRITSKLCIGVLLTFLSWQNRRFYGGWFTIWTHDIYLCNVGLCNSPGSLSPNIIYILCYEMYFHVRMVNVFSHSEKTFIIRKWNTSLMCASLSADRHFPRSDAHQVVTNVILFYHNGITYLSIITQTHIMV